MAPPGSGRGRKHPSAADCGIRGPRLIQALGAHCTLAEAFERLVNEGARLAPEGGGQSATVEIPGTEAHPGVIFGGDKFHGAGRIAAEAECPDGDRLACAVTLERPADSTRPIGYTLTICPERPLAADCAYCCSAKKQRKAT